MYYASGRAEVLRGSSAERTEKPLHRFRFATADDLDDTAPLQKRTSISFPAPRFFKAGDSISFQIL